MNRIVLAMVVLSLVFTHAWAQKPVAQKAIALFYQKQVQTFSLFSTPTPAKEETKQYVDSAFHISISPDVLASLQQANAGLVTLQLPGDIKLDLYRAEVFSTSAEIKTSDGRSFTPDPNHLFYRGMIQGDPHSLAIVSVFEERIQILFANKEGNKRIQKMSDGHYLLFADKDIKIPNEITCSTDEIEQPEPNENTGQTTQRVQVGNCIQVYVECDFKSYQDNGSSVPNTEEWVAEMWNEVITLYENEDIPVAVSDVLIYTSTNPTFDTLTTTGAILSAFRIHIDNLTYDGRLAHFLSTRNIGGGVAYLDVLCSNSHQVAVSASLSTTIVPFPTYSWTVEVVTHEMGHNIGSQHTHACAWNGNNTAIDGCGPAAGYSEGCSGPLPGSGTIMSYCHLVSGIGINFANGFGTQPGDRIRSKYANANCSTGICTPPTCNNLTLPVPSSINVDVNQDLFWAAADGADGYKLTIGTTPTNGSILNNVDVGQVTTYNPANAFPFSETIYVKIVPYNIIGDAIGCSNHSFSTEANVAPACTAISYPVDGAVEISADAIITWNHSVGNQTGYKISIGTTLNGTQIANNVNVGNVTSYDHPSSFPYATLLYVKITPYWSGGDINNCPSQSFTTIIPVEGDFCTDAISLPCGATIEGSTVDALPDTGLPVCVVNVEAPGIWYTFVGDGQNTIIATCAGANYDTQINAYKGSCGSLVCVTGIDDFCSTSSLVSFPTISGTTYYILVQGWGGETGDYTITRTCYSGPFYCMSAGRNPALEWIANVTFAGEANASGSSSYSDFMAEPIVVSRGGSYTIQINPAFAQNPRSQYYKVWIDYNHDGDFTDSGEMVYSAGPTNSSVTGTFTIPITAIKENTRMRVAMRYNATPSNSCSVFSNGEVEDYALDIRCNLVTSTSDSGNGSLRNVSNCVDDNEPVLFASSLNGQILTVTGSPISVDGTWKWMPAAGSNIEIKASNVSRILTVPSGFSAEVQNLKFVGGTATQGSAIDNLGTLIIRDCDIHPAIGSSSTPLRNTGTMNVFGICDIKF